MRIKQNEDVPKYAKSKIVKRAMHSFNATIMMAWNFFQNIEQRTTQGVSRSALKNMEIIILCRKALL